MRNSCGIRYSVRRLFVAAFGVAALSLIWSTAAFAQAPGVLGLGSPSGSGGSPVGTVVGDVTEVVAPVTQTAAPVVQDVAAPVAQVTAPVAQTADPVVQTAAPEAQSVTTPVARVTAPVVQTAAPVVNTVTAPVAQVTAPVVRAVAPVVQAAAPVVQIAAPVIEPLTEGIAGGGAPLLGGNDDDLAGLGSLLGRSTAPASAASSPDGSTPFAAPHGSGAAGDAPVSPVSPGTDLQAPIFAVEEGGAGSGALLYIDRPASGFDGAGSLATPLGHPTPQVWAGSARATWASGPDAVSGTKARAPSTPRPGAPSSPALPSSVAAMFSGSGAPIFVAALVAALLLAVPGLSRRLRLELAPWPLPTAVPSLERPG